MVVDHVVYYLYARRVVEDLVCDVVVCGFDCEVPGFGARDECDDL